MAAKPDDAPCLDIVDAATEEAVAEAVQSHEGRLRRYLRRLLPEPETADDVLQQTFLELVQAVRRTGTMPSMPGWLYRAAANNARDAGRRRQVRARTIEALTRVGVPSRDAGADAVERMAVERALARLSAEDRTCVLLSAQAGLAYHEIARAIGISGQAARQRITRAKVRFRRQYEKEL